MRLRKIILILAIFAFASASTGGWLYYYSYREAALEKIKTHGRTKLKLLAGQLSGYLTEHLKSVKTLAGVKELARSFEQPNLDTIFRANQVLDLFTRSLGVDVCYLMDKNGVTLCSSNRNHRDSFVGHNFSFRPYYRSAIQGKTATYLALGTTSMKRGIYYSHPVYAASGKDILGVAVIKSSVESVEANLFEKTEEIFLFVDPAGMIFISSIPHLKFSLLWEEDERKINQIEDSRQFGNGPWEWSGFTLQKSGEVTDKTGAEFFYSSMEVPNYPGWQIISLRNTKEIEKIATEPFKRVIRPMVAIVSALAGLMVFTLYQLAAREITRRKQAEFKLRESEERYRHIYHKTPVMLHSIDLEGKITRVSDHWLDVMGVSRQEVIGCNLTDFFTEASKEYALKVIFPRFFSTGFCKDIPYTMVRKNGEKMDILLSCYGVKGQNGRIIRSLAVSVDVTEKNRTQKDLQEAKEKLAQYSHNLELRVSKRTAQLEKARNNLKNLSKNIIASQEREKEQVARELHDHLGQVLTALRIDTVWVESRVKDCPVKDQTRVRKMKTLIDRTIQDVRNMAYRLRPRVLDDLGLAEALDSLVSDFEKRSNVSCAFSRGPIPDIENTLATALYRIGQEALTNAIRHSGATTIHVSLGTAQDNPDLLELVVEDDGTGFDPACLPGKQQGFGLEGMRERADLVGGTLDLSSVALGGTRICCRIKMKG